MALRTSGRVSVATTRSARRWICSGPALDPALHPGIGILSIRSLAVAAHIT
jgi:hypothetical protein